MYLLKKMISVTVVSLTAVILLSGCGLGEKAVEKAIEQTTGVKVDSKDNTVTFNTKDGQVQIAADSGKVPDGFPLPVIPGGKVDSSMTSTENGAKNYVVSLSSSKSIQELAAFYEDALKAKGIKPEKMEMKDETSHSIFYNGKADKLDANVQIYEGESIGQKGFVVNLLVKVTE